MKQILINLMKLNFLSNNRNRLLALLTISTIGIFALAWQAGSSDFSYYVEPKEFLTRVSEDSTNRWRVGGRIVDGTVVEKSGRPVNWDIVGSDGSKISIQYEGVVPNLFTEGAFIVVEGYLNKEKKSITASSVVIKHENEFFSDTPPPDSPSANLYKEN